MFHTKSQRNRFCSECPIARVADIIGDSAVQLIVRDLLLKPRRFGDFKESLEGISTRTLTKKLRMLEQYGILFREEFHEYPPRVLYSLTKKGRGLHSVAEAMRKYGEKYLS